MQIRDAKPTDKHHVLEFCKHTFSWGDYIADVWDCWLSQGNLFVIVEENATIGICHLVMTDKRQAWIEGIRIHPSYRKKGYGKKIITHCESIAKSCKTVRMIIDSDNIPSINLARATGYYVEDKWRLYGLLTKKENSSAVLASNLDQVSDLISSNTYADSWKWLPLERQDVEDLIRQRRVLISAHEQNVNAVAIWNESKDFTNVLQIGFLNGTLDGMRDILRFISNKGYEINSERIQVFSQEKSTLDFGLLTKRSLFYLMRKDL